MPARTRFMAFFSLVVLGNPSLRSHQCQGTTTTADADMRPSSECNSALLSGFIQLYMYLDIVLLTIKMAFEVEHPRRSCPGRLTSPAVRM